MKLIKLLFVFLLFPQHIWFSDNLSKHISCFRSCKITQVFLDFCSARLTNAIASSTDKNADSNPWKH